MKVVINQCHGGFGLSPLACERLGGIDPDSVIARYSPELIAVVEELGQKANGYCAQLEIVETDGRLFRIAVYDGYEWIDYQDESEWLR